MFDGMMPDPKPTDVPESTNCKHTKTISVVIEGQSDMRECVDCRATFSGRELARLRLPPLTGKVEATMVWEPPNEAFNGMVPVAWFAERESQLQDAVTEIQQLRTELKAKDTERERLMDLVRYMRQELLTAKLIDQTEYAALCADTDNGQRVARLESYDQLRAAKDTELAAKDARIAELTAGVLTARMTEDWGASRWARLFGGPYTPAVLGKHSAASDIHVKRILEQFKGTEVADVIASLVHGEAIAAEREHFLNGDYKTRAEAAEKSLGAAAEVLNEKLERVNCDDIRGEHVALDGDYVRIQDHDNLLARLRSIVTRRN